LLSVTGGELRVWYLEQISIMVHLHQDAAVLYPCHFFLCRIALCHYNQIIAEPKYHGKHFYRNTYNICVMLEHTLKRPRALGRLSGIIPGEDELGMERELVNQ
jgi:hypothetical protein